MATEAAVFSTGAKFKSKLWPRMIEEPRGWGGWLGGWVVGWLVWGRGLVEKLSQSNKKRALLRVATSCYDGARRKTRASPHFSSADDMKRH